jgi:hypothetical protein
VPALDKSVAPPLLTYADVMATLTRNLEAASEVYERFLALYISQR